MKNKLNVGCGACRVKPRVDFISTLLEFYGINLSKFFFADLCSKLTLVDVFGHMSRFLNCFQQQFPKPFSISD